MSIRKVVSRNAISLAVALGALLLILPNAAAQITPDGVLDQEAEAVLDTDASGLPDILDGRDGVKGVAFFRLDGVRDGDIEGNFPDSGPDGFGDAGYSDIPTACTDCVDNRLIVRSTINTGKLTIVYLADTDGIIGQCDGPANTGDPCTKNGDCPGGACTIDLAADDSLLYVGFDIYNGNPRDVGNPAGVEDVDFHHIDFVDTFPIGNICQDGVADFLTCNETEPPQSTNCVGGADGVADFLGVPFDVDGDGDPMFVTRWNAQPTPSCQPDDVAELDLSEEQYRVLLYLCAPALEELDANPNAQLPANIGQLFVKAANGSGSVEADKSSNLVLPTGTDLWADFFDSYPDDGDLVANVMGDVEFVVRHVDTLVHAQCGRDPVQHFPAVVCTGDFALDRFQFAQGGVRTMSDSDADGSDEDFITATWFAPIPEIEVTKDVRCVGETVWEADKTVEAMPGSPIEFKIEVENTGNVDLAVCLEDVLEKFGTASVTPVDDSLEVTLFRDPVCPLPLGCEVTFANALLFDPPLRRDFIGDPLDANDQGFLDDLDGTCSYLGVLKGVQVCDDPANPILGDRVVITFEATVDGTFDSCCDPVPPTVDVKNSVTAIGDPDIPPGNTFLPPDDDEAEDVHGNVPFDPTNHVDTRRERIQNFDDNVVTVDVKCRDIEFDKTATARDDNGTPLDTTDLPLVDTGQFPVFVDYVYTLVNNGELTENVTITEKFLCGDVSAVPGVSFDGSCPVCAGGASGTADPCGGTVSTTCTVKFETPTALETFLARDDTGRPTCTANDPVDEPDPLCYKNCANASVHAPGLPPQCNVDAAFSDDEIICASGCAIDVIKEVKCDDDADYAPLWCDTNSVNAGDSCVDSRDCDDGECVSTEPRQQTFADEVLNYRMTVKNTGASVYDSVALTDAFTCRQWLVSGSFEAKALDASGAEIPWPYSSPTPGELETWFDSGGARTCFPFVPAFASETAVVLTFDVRVPADYDTAQAAPECENCLTAEGYIDEPTCLPPLNPDDACWDKDCAEIEVLVPKLVCDKEVCVDDAVGNNHGCFTDSACPRIDALEITFPLTLTYTFAVENPANSETPLTNVSICDQDLRDHAQGYAGTCALLPADGCMVLADLPVGGPPESADCTVVLQDIAEWEAFATLDDGNKGCYRNSAVATAEPDVGDDVCGEDHVESTCDACVCIGKTKCTCTKAKFDVWNENETKFSGTHRCICHWDETKISEYDPPNHMLIQNLQTDKGKARIEGMASPVVCGEDSVDAPLIGVAAKLIDFNVGTAQPPRAVAGIPMTGLGVEAALIEYTPVPAPLGSLTDGGDLGTGRGDPRYRLTPVKPERLRETTPATASAQQCDDLAPLTSQKGSVLVYPKLEVIWDVDDNVMQDVFVTILNDFTEDVTIQTYLVLTCDLWIDNTFVLTMNEPAYWSMITGAPKGAVSFSSLIPFREPDPDPRNPGGTRLRGYLLAWAIDPIAGSEIHWNHLAGTATTINYQYGNAWEYATWAFQAVSDGPEGTLLPTPGQLNMDGNEFDWAPAMLLLDFYATGARLTSGGNEVTPILQIDTDLTFWAAIKDLTGP